MYSKRKRASFSTSPPGPMRDMSQGIRQEKRNFMSINTEIPGKQKET
jgi:hypothetical protein